MSVRSSTVVVCIAALTTSCSTTYTPKKDEEVASLRFVTHTTSARFRMIDNKACPAEKLLISEQIGDLFQSNKSIGMMDPPTKANSFIETRIPSNEKAIFTVGDEQVPVQFVPGYKCYIGVAFQPRKDTEYEVHYKYERGSCGVGLFELVAADGGKAERVPINNARTFTAGRLFASDDMCNLR